MSGVEFDAYYVWLGIPPPEQPPDHYRLLGLRRFEDNVDVISNAADQRMAFVRSAQTGEHAHQAQRLLNEISQARVVLSDAQRKAAYDRQLREPDAAGGRYGEQPILTSPGRPGRTDSAPTQTPPLRTSRSKQPPARKSARPAPAVAVGKEVGDVPPSRGTAWLFAIIGALAAAGLFAAAVLALGFMFFQPWSSTADNAVARNDVAKLEIVLPDDASQIPPIDPAELAATVSTNENESSSNESQPSIDSSNDAVSPHEPIETVPSTDEPDAPRPTVYPVVVQEPDDGQNDPSETPQPNSLRASPPPLDEQRELLARLDELYPAAELAAAQQKLDLAQQLLKMGSDQRTDVTERFVMLRRAAELSSDAGDVGVMSRAVSTLGETFDVDPRAIEGKLLARMAQAGVAARQVEDYASYVCDFADAAVVDDEYEVAAWLLVAAGKAISEASAREMLHGHLERVESRRQRFLAFQEAERAVSINPRDGDAQLVVGQWYGFEKADWERGLAHLAQGSDDLIRVAAARELDRSADTDQLRLAAGDLWWSAAKDRDEPLQRPLMRRAAFWYGQVDEKAFSGLDQAKLQIRREQLQAMFAAHSATAAGSGSLAGDDAETDDRFTALFDKGVAAVKEHRYGDADRMFGQCVRLRPDDVSAINNYAITGVRVGQTQRAVRQWQRVVELDIPAGAILHNLVRMRQEVQRKTIPLDARAGRDLDDLIETAQGHEHFGRYAGSTGWLYNLASDGQGAMHEDQACMLCQGTNQIDCPVKGCSRGKIRVMTQSVVGRNPITGEVIVQSTPVSVPCKECDGEGTVSCRACDDGVDRRFSR